MEHLQGDPEKQQELEQHEVKEVLGFLTHYGKLIGAGVAVAAVVALGSSAYRHYQASRIAEAEQALINARSAQSLEETINRYRSTPIAPVALLNLAKLHFNNGETAQARAQYERFLKEYGSHEMRPVAELGLAYCAEADGDFGGAAEAFRALAESNSGRWLHPQAVLGRARCLELAGRFDDARIVLEDFLAASAGTGWAASAEDALKRLNERAKQK